MMQTIECRPISGPPESVPAFRGGRAQLADYRAVLACPACRGPFASAQPHDAGLHCPGCGASYPVAAGRPVLMRPDNALFRADDYRAPSPAVPPRGRPAWRGGASINFARDDALKALGERLAGVRAPRVLIVGGGQQRGELERAFAAHSAALFVYSDVDARADVELYCDAHDLPFAAGTFDAVVATAVLEHVLYPERVVAEIHRVLGPRGIVYSEVPFLQQVHEGAYDFTRYTLSGHRRLFNHFERLGSGMVAGPATSLVWAIEGLVLALAGNALPRRVTKAGVRLAFGWIRHLDRWLRHRPAAVDAASCTYFFGRKAATVVPDALIVEQYVGAQHRTMER